MVGGAPPHQVRPEEIHHARWEPRPGDDLQQRLVVEGWKELSDVEGNDTRLQASGPPHTNEVSEVDPGVLSGTLGDAPKLHGLEGIVGHSVKLKPACQHLLD